MIGLDKIKNCIYKREFRSDGDTAGKTRENISKWFSNAFKEEIMTRLSKNKCEIRVEENWKKGRSENK